MPETAENLDQWIARGALAQERLRVFLARADDAQTSAIFLETALLLTREGLSPQNGEGGGDMVTWVRTQLDHLWLHYGAKNPRRWAREVALMLARLSGPAVVEFFDLARGPIYKEDPAARLAAFLLGEQQGTIRLENGKIRAVPEKPKEPKKAENTCSAPPLHRGQRHAFERCLALAKLHYSGLLKDHALQPRSFVFIIGPTGCGKSHVARAVASALGAYFLPLTFGRWCPNGGRDSRPTLFTVLDALRKHSKVVVFIDELDKFYSAQNSGGGWSMSCLNDLYALLDRQLPLEDFKIYERTAAKSDGEKPPKETEGIDVNRLWICGAGTWQNLTNPSSTAQRKIGFGPATIATNSMARDEKILAGVRASKDIPEELLARFHADPVLIGYPSPDEIPDLLGTFGITELAARAGVDLSGHKFDFTLGGIRVLEALAADLALKILAKEEAKEAKNHER